MTRKQFFAWCVHLYTASGLVIVAFTAAVIVRGGAARKKSDKRFEETGAVTV